MPHNSSQINLRWLTFSLVAGFCVMGVKFSAYYITFSNAILSDALESIINLVAGSVALISVYFSSLPKDNNHPYGHGKVEFLSAGFEGAIIAIAGISIVVKGIYNLFFPNALAFIDIGMVLVAFGGTVNFILGWFLVKNGKKSNSIATISSGKHLLSDAYSTIALLAGLALLYVTKLTWIDQCIAILMGGFILMEGIKLIRGALSGILDEADNELIKKVVEILEQNRSHNWIDIHNLRIIKYGSALHVDCHVTLPWYYDLNQTHHEVEIIEDIIEQKISNRVEFFIHADPCVLSSCKICLLSQCQVRQHAFEQRQVWEFENIIRNEKHGRNL